MSRLQNWSIKIHDMAEMVHKCTVDLSTKISLSQIVPVTSSNATLIYPASRHNPVQEHGQIVIDICLCEIVRKLLEIQYRLRNLKAVRVDSTVRVLSQAEFLCEKGTDVKPRANELARFAEVRRRKTSLNTISQFRYGLNGLV